MAMVAMEVVSFLSIEETQGQPPEFETKQLKYMVPIKKS